MARKAGYWGLSMVDGGHAVVRSTDAYRLGSGAPYRSGAEVGTPEWEAEMGDTIAALSDGSQRTEAGILFAEKTKAEAVIVLMRDLIKAGVAIPGWVWWAWAHGWRPIDERWVKKLKEGVPS